MAVNPGYTRRQELRCTLDDLSTYSGVILYEGEVLYVKQANGSYAIKIGDGETNIANLPYVINYSDVATQATNAAASATAAAGSATAASGSAQTAEAYAKGTKNGTDVPSTDPAYHNNAKYYAEQAADNAEAAAEEVLNSKAEAVALALAYDDETAYKVGNLLSASGKMYLTIKDAPAGTPVTNTEYFEEKSVSDIIEMIKNGSIQVGSAKEADSLKTSVGVTDNTPFSAETAGGDSDIQTGYQNLNKLVGCNVVKNQLVNPTNVIASTTQDGLTITNNGDGSVTITGTASADGYINLINNAIGGLNGHYVFYRGGTGASSSGSNIAVQTVGAETWRIRKGDTVTPKTSFSYTNGTTYNVKLYPMVNDLTLRYGSNAIVEAIIGGVPSIANLLAFDPNILKDTDYDTGSFSECKSASLESVEYNQFDQSVLDNVQGITKTGDYYYSGVSTWKAFFLANYLWTNNGAYNGRIGILFTGYGSVANINFRFVFFYTDGTNDIGDDTGSRLIRSTTPQNCYQISTEGKVVSYIIADWGNGGYVYLKDICPFLYWDGSRIGYEPYKKHSYPMPNVDLNGILKVVNGKVVADGDELTPDGSGNAQRWKKKKISDYYWTKETDGDIAYFRCTINDIFIPSDYASRVVDVQTTKYMPSISVSYGLMSDKSWLHIGRNFSVRDDTYSTAEAFVEANANVEFQYKLDTPTTLTADTFSRNVYMDDFGFISFLDENGNVIDGLQGNEILYKANVSGFAESLYVKADGDPEYFAPAEDLTDEALNARGYYKMQVLSSNGLVAENGITLRFPRLRKMGGVVFIDFVIQNTSGSAIPANTKVLTIDSSCKPTGTGYGILNGSNQGFEIKTTGDIATLKEIAVNGYSELHACFQV